MATHIAITQLVIHGILTAPNGLSVRMDQKKLDDVTKFDFLSWLKNNLVALLVSGASAWFAKSQADQTKKANENTSRQIDFIEQQRKQDFEVSIRDLDLALRNLFPQVIAYLRFGKNTANIAYITTMGNMMNCLDRIELSAQQREDTRFWGQKLFRDVQYIEILKTEGSYGDVRSVTQRLKDFPWGREQFELPSDCDIEDLKIAINHMLKLFYPHLLDIAKVVDPERVNNFETTFKLN